MTRFLAGRGLNALELAAAQLLAASVLTCLARFWLDLHRVDLDPLIEVVTHSDS